MTPNTPVAGGAGFPARRDTELQNLLKKMESHFREDAPAEQFAEALGMPRGVTGYVYHTVPMVLYCRLRPPVDFRNAVEEVIDLGDDTDSTGTVVGGIAGATLGASTIPAEWLDGLFEWPRSVGWMRKLAERLAGQFSGPGSPVARGPLRLFWLGLAPRNLLFFLTVLLHVLRHLLPPY